ncbi:MAG: S49 family peptidase [Thalassobaculaceae bacterium]|nr:S49 family peptidase [Thalassobaculaceae bacterium]
MAFFDPVLDRFRKRPPTVSVVPLRGVIAAVGPTRRGLSLETVAPMLEAAFKPKHTTAVALLINSPGGSPVQSDLIAQRIRDLAAEHEKPVTAFVEDVAASGGYWIACAADEILVNAASIIGSIGVVSAGFGFVEALDKLGVERRVHTAGSRKALLDPFRPERDEDVAHLKAIQVELHHRFIDWVQDRRGAQLKAGEEPELFEGKFWTGMRGIQYGLADGEGELRRTMRARHGDKTRFQLIERRRSLMERLRFGASIDPVAIGEGAMSAIGERAMWSRFGL